LWLLVVASGLLLTLAPVFSIAFMGSSLSSVLVYIWSRRNPDAVLSFLGIIAFRAPWLPFVLMAFGLAVHGVVPKDDIIGIMVGHGKLS
jgi:Derlin-2/3